MKNLYFLFLFALVNITCHRAAYLEAPISLMPLLKEFVEEGAERNIKIDLEENGLIIELDSLASHQAGRCRPNDYPKIITLNKVIWESLDTFQKKALLFHELGHCVLKRKHRNDLLPLGECASLLIDKEKEANCSQNLYSNIWWTYYLDELFYNKIKLPFWYEGKQKAYKQEFQKEYLFKIFNPNLKKHTNHSLLEKHLKKLRISDKHRGFWQFIALDSTRNFQIEVAYSPSHQSNRAYSLLWNDLKIEIHTTYFLLNALRSNTKQHRYGVQTFLCKKKLSEHVLQKKITIRKLNQLLYFYFNEELFHIMEYDYHKGKGNYFANLSTLDMIKTTFFSGELVDFRVEVAYLK